MTAFHLHAREHHLSLFNIMINDKDRMIPRALNETQHMYIISTYKTCIIVTFTELLFFLI